MKSQYWADQIAEKLIKDRKKKTFVVASGITPSGTIHFGNFREIITTDLVFRALKDKGAKVRFLYSWDDYDRFRKVPGNMPKKDILKRSLGLPVSSVPNVFGTRHKSYAAYIEDELEQSVEQVGIDVEFVRQNEKYRNCDYAKGIKTALTNRKKIASILDKYRKEPLPKNWYPATVYCEKCGSDNTTITNYNEEYSISYSCTCGHKSTFDFRKKGLIKLRWKADWPMRWAHEKVDFEPGGKDHSTYGSSYTVGKDIVKIFGWTAPEYTMYDFINMKGMTGKMASSKGNTQALKDVLKYYIPELLRYTFAGRTPKTEIFYPMDDGIFKHYEDFYYTERAYYGKENISAKEKIQRTRIYEMSAIKKPAKTMPVQPAFKHCVELMNISQGDISKALNRVKRREGITKKADVDRYRSVLERAWSWIQDFAEEKYIFKVNEKAKIKLSKNMKGAISDMTIILAEKLDEKKLADRMREVIRSNDVPARDFFQTIYKILISKTAGPRLAPFIMAIGQEKARKLLKSTI